MLTLLPKLEIEYYVSSQLRFLCLLSPLTPGNYSDRPLSLFIISIIIPSYVLCLLEMEFGG
jgi:hypothetical protein